MSNSEIPHGRWPGASGVLALGAPLGVLVLGVLALGAPLGVLVLGGTAGLTLMRGV